VRVSWIESTTTYLAFHTSGATEQFNGRDPCFR
jgi:hypothetical protein